MSKISVILSADQVLINALDLLPNYADIVMGVEIPSGQKVNNFDKLSFGYTIYRSREVLSTRQWPADFSKYVQSDQVFLETDRVHWQPQWPLRIEAWFRESGRMYTGFLEFTVPVLPDNS